MSDEPNTIDTILDDMLNEGHTGPADALEWVQTKMEYYANRIKAAWKRQCSQSWHHREMEELILRHEKEVNELQRQQIDNAAKLREAVVEALKILNLIGSAGDGRVHFGDVVRLANAKDVLRAAIAADEGGVK